MGKIRAYKRILSAETSRLKTHALFFAADLVLRGTGFPLKATFTCP